LSNKSAQLDLQLSLGALFRIINRKYICTITTKKNYSVNPNQT